MYHNNQRKMAWFLAPTGNVLRRPIAVVKNF
jgi:hypothetical protein